MRKWIILNPVSKSDVVWIDECKLKTIFNFFSFFSILESRKFLIKIQIVAIWLIFCVVNLKTYLRVE